jgi:hypothetical protein
MGKEGPRLRLQILVEDLVRRDQGSDGVRRRFEALEEVLVVHEPLSQWEALDVLELHIRGCLGHCQRDGHPSMNAMLNRRSDQRSRAEKMLLLTPAGARTKSARTSVALQRDSTSTSSSAQNKQRALDFKINQKAK